MNYTNFALTTAAIGGLVRYYSVIGETRGLETALAAHFGPTLFMVVPSCWS